MTQAKVGFIGLGLMGRGMSKNILSAGYPLFVAAHRNRNPICELVEQGATEASDFVQLARECDVVLLCLSNSDAVESAIFDKEGLLAGAKPGTIFVDTGTSLPSRTKKVNFQVREADCLFAAAPLSRTPKQAEQGKLLSFVSCESELFSRIRPILATYSEAVEYIDERVEAAHEIKLINNIIALSYIGIWAQAYNSCIASGLDPSLLHRVVSGAGLDCTNFQNFSKFVLENDQTAHLFSIANSHKDVNYYIEFAKESGVDVRIAEQVKSLFNEAMERGYGDDFTSVMTKVVGEINGTAAADLPRNEPD